jgi:hypothetical protein
MLCWLSTLAHVLPCSFWKNEEINWCEGAKMKVGSNKNHRLWTVAVPLRTITVDIGATFLPFDYANGLLSLRASKSRPVTTSK